MKSKSTYLTGEAILPDGDIRLFSTAKDSKGNLTRPEIYAQISTFKSTHGVDRVKAHFGNYTQVGSTELESLIKSFAKKAPSKVAPAAKVVPAKVVATKAVAKAAPVAPKAVTSKAVVSSEDSDFNELRAAQRAFTFKPTKR